MKEELLLEGRNPQAMPLSKVVKSSLSANIKVKDFALKDMVAEAKAADTERLSQEAARRKLYDDGVSVGFEQGSKKGLSEGYTKGFADGEHLGKTVKEADIAEYHKTARLLLQLVADLQQLTEKIANEAENDVLTLSIAVAKRIVQKEIAQDTEILLGFVKEGLKGLGPAETAFIRVHPDDFELLSRKSDDLLQAVQGVRCLHFEQDPNSLPYDAMVESQERSVDVRLDSQITMIARRLLVKADEGKGL
jgi:flagellar biosynthesis/type III secretory pathway protein FliH